MKHIVEKIEQARLWDHTAFDEASNDLMYLGIEMGDRYTAWKKKYYELQNKIVQEFEEERKNHQSDLATTKALNKKYIKLKTECDRLEDLYTSQEIYYKVLKERLDKINSANIRELAERKNQNWF